ncbi:hypothetical protein [Paracoccus sp. (in: a-proteobacteria)]|uniref:hypothetical protein n=1 Tax=Paracoccus sp. TaxID=267 RepID=UPI00272BAC01|nr:hypothetical protein [Paracoccus sp. (in: a-proteobacteria)]
MTEPRPLEPDARMRPMLNEIRQQDHHGVIGPGDNPVGHDAFLSLDPEAGITGRFASRPGQIIELELQPAFGIQPRWQGLHLPLGPVDLSDAAAFGLIARSVAPLSMTTRICLRSGVGADIVDVFLPRLMVSYDQPSLHHDLIEPAAMPDLPQQADWRDLILFFRPGPVRLTVLDLRLFLV